MALIGIFGTRKQLCKRLVVHATKTQPALIFDCANGANPHALFPEIQFEDLHGVYVLELEVLYRFRDALKRAARLLDELGARYLFVTPFTHLFNYQNDAENENIYRQCWEILRFLGTTHTVIVGIEEPQLANAKKYCHSIKKLRGETHGTYRLEPKDQHQRTFARA